MTRRLTLAVLLAAVVASVTLVAQPAVNFLNARVALDSNGYLIVALASQGTGGPAANVANTRVKVDSNGALMVAWNGTGLFADGTAAAPSMAFASQTGLGAFKAAASTIDWMFPSYSTTNSALRFQGGEGIIIGNGLDLAFTTSSGAGGTVTTRVSQPAAGHVLLSGVSSPMQVRTTQTTVPTCTTNCGTPGNVCVGTDTAMICTMGTTPASGFVVNFNGTWAGIPSCTAQAALAGMATGKKPLTVVPSTTLLTVVTDGTAPVAGDKYAIQCVGVQ